MNGEKVRGRLKGQPVEFVVLKSEIDFDERYRFRGTKLWLIRPKGQASYEGYLPAGSNEVIDIKRKP